MDLLKSCYRVLFICMCFVIYSDSLRCYSCDGCEDPFYPSLEHVQDCNRNTPGPNRNNFLELSRTPKCVKIFAPEGTIQRGCGGSQSGQIGCEVILNGATVCTCQNELCNTGSLQVRSPPWLLLTGFCVTSLILLRNI